MPPGNPPPYPPPPSGPYGPPPSGPSGPYPPPPPPPYSAPPQGYYAPPPPRKTNWVKIILLVVGIVFGLCALLGIVGVVIYFVVGKDTVTATDVEVGDCLSEIPDSARVLTVKTVECDQQHAGEVYAVLTMPEGAFPGQAAVDEFSNKCEPELAAYSPDAMTDDSIQMYVLYPTAESWEQGDRAVTCVATLDPPRTGSIKG
jgi:Septum formation